MRVATDLDSTARDGRVSHRFESEAEQQDQQLEQEEALGASKCRRANKPLEKKYNCPQEGCEKRYSRAEHLYRHQLNRMSTPPSIASLLKYLQTHQSRYMPVITRAVTAGLFDKIFARGTRSGM